MLVKLLGKYDEAVKGTWYENGLTSGIGATKFGSSNTTTAAQYLTFVLKALGYEAGTDFQFREDIVKISYNALPVCQKGKAGPRPGSRGSHHGIFKKSSSRHGRCSFLA